MGPEQPNFLNGAARFEFTSGATDLLDLLQSIESSHGRDRQKETRWGPRPLDLDILLFKDQKILTDRLSIPHPGLIERVFVLVPLCELAPNLVLPNGLTTRSAVEVLDTTEIKQLYTDQGLPYGNNNTNPH